MSTLHIILITLIIYSAITTAIYMLSGEREDILWYSGLGIVGLLLLCFFRVKYEIERFFKYRGKRSIFEDVESKQRYKCRISQSHDIKWLAQYRLIDQIADKEEWKDIPDFPNDVIKESRRNCNRCKYDERCNYDCQYSRIKCKHDEFGAILEFDKFEKK